MNPFRSALFATLLFFPAAAFAQLSDSDILNKLHSIDRAEIAAAGLVAGRSENGAVAKFAKTMIREHGKADESVVALAKKKGVLLIEATPAPDPLAQMRGVEFDRTYASAMVTGHEAAITFLIQADAQAKDAEVKKLVEKLQPVVEHHKKMAARLQSKFLSAQN